MQTTMTVPRCAAETMWELGQSWHPAMKWSGCGGRVGAASDPAKVRPARRPKQGQHAVHELQTLLETGQGCQQARRWLEGRAAPCARMTGERRLFDVAGVAALTAPPPQPRGSHAAKTLLETGVRIAQPAVPRPVPSQHATAMRGQLAPRP